MLIHAHDSVKRCQQIMSNGLQVHALEFIRYSLLLKLLNVCHIRDRYQTIHLHVYLEHLALNAYFLPVVRDFEC